MDEELDLASFGADIGDQSGLGGLEGTDELAPDDLSLGLGIADPVQGVQKTLRLVDGNDANAHSLRVIALNLLTLPGAEQAVVDEKARELIAHGGVDEGCGHGRIDASRKRAYNLGPADPPPYRLDLFVDDVARRPHGLEPRAFVKKVLKGGLSVGRMPHLWVPLQAEQLAVAVLEGRNGGLRGRGRDLKSFGRRLDGVAVAHPHDLVGRSSVEKAGAFGHTRLGVPVLAGPRSAHRSPEGLRHGLEAVANAEDGHPGVENRGIERRRPFLVNGRGASREDDRRRVFGEHVGRAGRVGNDFGIDVGFAHSPCDELGILRTKVDDEDRTWIASHASRIAAPPFEGCSFPAIESLGGFQCNLQSIRRIDELQPRGQELQIPAVAHLRVQPIADDRNSEVAHRDAYLMCAASFRFDFVQPQPSALVGQSHRRNRIRLPVDHQRLQRSAGFGESQRDGLSLDETIVCRGDGQVRLSHLAPLEQHLVGSAPPLGQRQEQHAPRGSVEPVRRNDLRIGEVAPRGDGDGLGHVLAAGHGRHPGRFVDGDPTIGPADDVKFEGRVGLVGDRPKYEDA